MLNPITYTEKVARDFLRYQNTTHQFADPGLDEQMRRLLSMQETRKTPLMKGPYVSLSRLFQRGDRIAALVEDGVIHSELADRIAFERLYAHQERAVRSIVSGQPTLVSTGTGSGKTETFLYPIISRCLELRDEDAPAGITAVLVYPMNALAQDQLERVRGLLAGTGVSFGLYVGKTPEATADADGTRLAPGASGAEYREALEQSKDTETTVFPAEECISREEMRQADHQPRILLTNVKQLELLLTRQRDVELFDNARLEYLVLDEAHTFRGAMGAETACLVRRLRSYCGRSPDETVCVATSATIADPDDGREDAQDFMSRLFGVAAKQVEFVSEDYADETWRAHRQMPPSVEGNPLMRLDRVLEALRKLDDDAAVTKDRQRALRNLKTYVHTLTDHPLDQSRWREHLYEILAKNEVAFQIATHLDSPRPLEELTNTLSSHLDRQFHPAEVLTWLALGAAARSDDRPLLRPVVHSFVRGVDGAVVTFPPNADNKPSLWLSAEDAASKDDTLFRFEVMTCTTCGQHYFPHTVAGFDYTEDEPGGGQADGRRRLWPSVSGGDGSRVILVDSLAFAENTGLEQDPSEATDRVSSVMACRQCGSLHSLRGRGCGHCHSEESLVELYAVEQKEDNPGHLTSCIACNARGRNRHGRYREPARPVRAVTVADVHVIAQSMLQHADRERLLVFTDNRQDAAFQAGWMRDHARRFRLRSLIFEEMTEAGISVGDLSYQLDQRLEQDEGLSRALVPEVWKFVRRESSGQQHELERRKYLRIQVLRELTTSVRQRLGLESWGRIKIDYPALEGHPFFATWAPGFNCSADRLEEGVATWLDVTRRANILYDRDHQIFSRYLSDETPEVRHGYIPQLRGGPLGLKLERGANDDKNRVRQILTSTGHRTLATDMVLKWGLPSEDVESFWEELWQVLTDELSLLEPVTLTWPSGHAIPGCQGVRQIDADHLRVKPDAHLYRCPKCRRAYPRRTPNMTCPGWRCDGKIQFEREPKDDYNLMLLDERFSMVRPREHSGQVPNERREHTEKAFKGSGNSINTLVSTPTLELGVDIGSLDSVFMRNVPPLPANYWQRVGRAGRRHRMAVNITYARPVTHDRAYFDEPLKMLDGIIKPPSFNLKNEVMVRKHVHATVVSYLYRITRQDDSLSEEQVRDIRSVLGSSFPTRVRNYLFEPSGRIRRVRFDLEPLSRLIEEYKPRILAHVAEVFEQHWPTGARTIVNRERLETYIIEMTDALDEVIARLEQRLRWAHNQMRRLADTREEKGVLDHAEEKLRQRCSRLINRLKGKSYTRSGAEGYDDTYTYSVLAAEGFLPGYGLDSGGVTAHHLASETGGGQRDWTVRRPLSMAVREFIPGNLIYANGNRYAPRYFQLPAEQATPFHVDVEHEAVIEKGGGRNGDSIAVQMSETSIDAVPICDVELPHTSSISDDEEYRFQLPSSVYGYELERHGEGQQYDWGSRQLSMRDAVRLRMVNVGPSILVGNGQLGFPVCLVCGASRSPFASDSQLEGFEEWHREHCGRQPGRIGFFANIVADTLTLPLCNDRDEGYSVLEAIRHGANRVLEMELGDLQLLSLGRPGQDVVDMALYDPMPGGSGLLDQILERWDEVWEAAVDVVEGCPSACDRVCIDCLMTYRNMHYHRYLDRHLAAEKLQGWGDAIDFVEMIEARLPGKVVVTSQLAPAPVELVRAALATLGFGEPATNHVIDLKNGQGVTHPDFFFPDGAANGVCLYVGEPEDNDEQTRRWQLEGMGYRSIDIPKAALSEAKQFGRHLSRLAYTIRKNVIASRVQKDDAWFEEAHKAASSDSSNEQHKSPDPDTGWELTIQLLAGRWAPLAKGLSTTGLRAPDAELKGLVVDGRVSDHRAIMLWEQPGGDVALVSQQTADCIKSTDAVIVAASSSSDPTEVASCLKNVLTED